MAPRRRVWYRYDADHAMAAEPAEVIATGVPGPAPGPDPGVVACR